MFIFTKVQMNVEADRILLKYFNDNIRLVEKWFNVVLPSKKSIVNLQADLNELKNKNWKIII